MSMPTSYNYILCGWRTRTDVPLTGVPVCEVGVGRVDVAIQLRSESSPIASFTEWSDTAECVLIRVKEVADFEVSYGRQIRIWPAECATLKDIEIFLFGPVWGVLCHQRGIFPLHASAVLIDGGITAFAGRAGAGKSTTAALIAGSEHGVVADDVLPISFSQEGVPGAWPFLRRFKLKRAPMRQLEFAPIDVVNENFENQKYFAMPRRCAPEAWTKIDRIYHLEVDPSVHGAQIELAIGAEAVRILAEQTYRVDFILSNSGVAGHFSFCTKIADKTRIYRLRRSPALSAGEELRSLIFSHLDGCIRKTRLPADPHH